MIDAVLHFAYLQVKFVLSMLPSYNGLPSGLQNALSWIFGVNAGLSQFVPVSTIYTIVLLIMTVEIGILGFRFFAWLFHWQVSSPNKA
jgi:hypothetical protein